MMRFFYRARTPSGGGISSQHLAHGCPNVTFSKATKGFCFTISDTLIFVKVNRAFGLRHLLPDDDI